MPLVSIITITYNAEKYLERTILSVKNQTLQDYEYILIDGGSKDKTLEIANKYKVIFSQIISEPDKGLYDAMNKGMTKSHGDYIWFMNAGDEIAETDAIAKIKVLASNNADVIYGEALIVDDAGNELGLRSEKSPHKLPDNLSWQQFNKGMLVCHQAFLAKRNISKPYLLNNLSADIDWEINCLKQSINTVKYHGILANYLEGGVSHQNLMKSWIDRYIVLKKHFGFWSNILNHIKIIFRADIFNILRLSKYVK